MGYTIKIGNAEPYHGKDCGELSAGWSVKLEKHEAAPAYGEPTDHENQRWPSYSAWADCMKALGLYELFLGEDGLMRPHPGCKLITEEHVGIVRAAVEHRRATNYGKAAGFFDHNNETHEEIDNGKDPQLARGEWLLYWMAWAVDNCETPAIENS